MAFISPKYRIAFWHNFFIVSLSIACAACPAPIQQDPTTHTINIRLDRNGNEIIIPDTIRAQEGDIVEICNLLSEPITMAFLDSSNEPGPFSHTSRGWWDKIRGVIDVPEQTGQEPACVERKVRKKSGEFGYVVVTKDTNVIAYPNPANKVSRPKIIIMG